MAENWTHACHMLWDLAGRPETTDPPSREGRCAHCGQVGLLAARLGPNFTDYRRLIHIDGSALCRACSWTTGGKPPRTLRMWSVVARIDQLSPRVGQATAPFVSAEYLHLTNLKDMRWVAATLADPPAGPWLVAVAESGKKHTAPFAAVNRGGPWTVQMDGCDVTSTPGRWREVLSRVVALRAAGFHSSAIDAGCPPVVALTPDRLSVWMTYAPYLSRFAGTPLLHLANLMICKELLGDFLTTYPAV